MRFKLSEIKNALNASTVSKRGDVITVRKEFYYRHGYTSERFAEDIKKVYPDAVILKHAEVWKPFRGGAPTIRQSHWWVKFTIPEKIATPEKEVKFGEVINNMMGKDAKEKKMKELTADDIKVHVLDWDRISADATKLVLENGVKCADGGVRTYPKDVTFKAHHKVGMVEEPHFALIDNECVGRVIPPGEKVEDQEWSFDFYKETKNTFAVFPSFTIQFDKKELDEYKTGEVKTLKEFMGDRYDYNSRIRGNKASFLRYFQTGK